VGVGVVAQDEPMAANQSMPDYVRAGCSLSTNGRVLNCEALQLTEVPDDIPETVTKLLVRNNRINDNSGTEVRRCIDTQDVCGSGQLTAAHLTTVQSHPSLTEIQLQGNGILSIANGTFVGFGTLQVLRLFGNGLQSLQSGVFEGLTGLVTLYINNNPLVRLVAGVFAPMATSLAELFVKDCHSLEFIEDESLNALQFRPLFVDMTNNPSLCAVSPFGALECICSTSLVGGEQGFCVAPTDAPSASPTPSATLSPSTSAPTTPAPVNSPTTSPTVSPTDSEIDREGAHPNSGVDGLLPLLGKSGKKGGKTGKGQDNGGTGGEARDSDESRHMGMAAGKAGKGMGETGIEGEARDSDESPGMGMAAGKAGKGMGDSSSDNEAVDREASGDGSDTGAPGERSEQETSHQNLTGKASKNKKKRAQLQYSGAAAGQTSGNTVVIVAVAGCVMAIVGLGVAWYNSKRLDYEKIDSNRQWVPLKDNQAPPPSYGSGVSAVTYSPDRFNLGKA